VWFQHQPTCTSAPMPRPQDAWPVQGVGNRIPHVMIYTTTASVRCEDLVDELAHHDAHDRAVQHRNGPHMNRLARCRHTPPQREETHWKGPNRVNRDGCAWPAGTSKPAAAHRSSAIDCAHAVGRPPGNRTQAKCWRVTRVGSRPSRCNSDATTADYWNRKTRHQPRWITSTSL